MGGCSSKPQTAETEGLLDPPPTKQELHLLFSGLNTTSNSSPLYQAGSQHTLKSLFSQHGRNGEDLVEDAQTLHDLLLHAVDSKSLSNFENPSAGNAITHKDLQPDLCFSSTSTEKTAEKGIKLEGSMPNLTEENDENCAKLEGDISTPVQNNSEKLGVVISNSPDENTDNCAKLGSAISIAGENADICAKLGSVISNLAGDKCAQLEGVSSDNLAGENTDECAKSGALISNPEGENADRCANLGPVISNLAGENAEHRGKLEAESSSRGASLEPTSDLDPISESESGDKGLDLEPKSDFLKISEPNFSENILTEAFNEMKASKAMETEAGEAQSLNEKAMESEKTEEAMEGKQLDASVEKAMDGEITEKAMEAEEKQMQLEEAMRKVGGANSLAPCEKACKCDISQEEVEKVMACTEKQAEKAMEVDEIAMGSERTGVQVDDEKENGQEHGKGDVKDGNAVCVMKAGTDGDKAELQDDKQAGTQERETGVHVERTEMQDEGVFHGEKAKAVCVEKAGTVQDGEKAELQNEMRIGLHDEKTEVQIEKADVQDDRAFHDDEKAKAVYVEKAETVPEDDRAFDHEKAKAVCVEEVGAVQDGRKAELRHELRAGIQDEEKGVQSEKTGVQEEAMVKTKVQDEEKAEDDLSPSHVNQSYAFPSESTHSSEHFVADACSDPLSRCTELPMVAPPCGPFFKLAPKENTIEAADLEKLESEQKKLAAEENTVEVAVFVPLESIVDAEYVKHIDGNARNTIESSSQLVVEHDISSDDCAMRADINVAGEDQRGFVQGAHEFSKSSKKPEPPNCGHNQTPIIDLDSMRIEAEQSPQMQVYDAFALHPPLAESSVHGNLSCPTVVDLGVDNGLVDISSSDVSTAEASVNEGVESKPRQESLGEDLVKASDNVNMVEEKDRGMIKKDEVMAQIEAPK